MVIPTPNSAPNCDADDCENKAAFIFVPKNGWDLSDPNWPAPAATDDAEFYCVPCTLIKVAELMNGLGNGKVPVKA